MGRQVACVAELRREPAGRKLARLLDVQRHDVDENDVVAGARKAVRVDAGPAADVEHPGRRTLECTVQQLERPHELERVALEAAALDTGPVVPLHASILADG
jgi:hypothetical protein